MLRVRNIACRAVAEVAVRLSSRSSGTYVEMPASSPEGRRHRCRTTPKMARGEEQAVRSCPFLPSRCQPPASSRPHARVKRATAPSQRTCQSSPPGTSTYVSANSITLPWMRRMVLKKTLPSPRCRSFSSFLFVHNAIICAMLRRR